MALGRTAILRPVLIAPPEAAGEPDAVVVPPPLLEQAARVTAASAATAHAMDFVRILNSLLVDGRPHRHGVVGGAPGQAVDDPGVPEPTRGAGVLTRPDRWTRPAGAWSGVAAIGPRAPGRSPRRAGARR